MSGMTWSVGPSGVAGGSVTSTGRPSATGGSTSSTITGLPTTSSASSSTSPVVAEGAGHAIAEHISIIAAFMAIVMGAGALLS